MFCKNCGSQLTENDVFCPSCGAAAKEQGNQPEVQQSVQPDTFQQPMNNPAPSPVQQNMGGMNNNVAPVQQPKNDNTTKYIILGVVGVFALIVICAVVGFIAMLSPAIDEAMKDVESTTENTTTVASNKSYKVKYDGFTLTIPDGYLYEEQNGVLLVGDEAGTIRMSLYFEQVNFSQLVAVKDKIPGVLQETYPGSTVSPSQLQTLGGVELITTEISKSGTNAIYSLAKVNSMYIADVILQTQDNTFDYKTLEKLAPIVGTAEMTEVSNSMATSSEFDAKAIGGSVAQQ